MKFLKSNWKWLIGIVITILASLIPFFVSDFFPINKKLSFRTDYYSSVIKEELLEKDNEFKIYYKDKEVKQGNWVVFSIFNNGEVPILKTDFEKPIEIKVTKDVSILNFKIVNSKPENFTPEFDLKKDKIIIKPLLINPSDYVQFKLLTAGDGKTVIKPTARIIDVPTITMLESSDIRLPLVYHAIDWPIGFFLSTIGLYLGIAAVLARRSAIYAKKIYFRPLELVIIGIVLCWPAGLALMDDGARYYNLYPSFLTRILIFAPIYAVLIYLLWMSRPNIDENKT